MNKTISKKEYTGSGLKVTVSGRYHRGIVIEEHLSGREGAVLPKHGFKVIHEIVILQT